MRHGITVSRLLQNHSLGLDLWLNSYHYSGMKSMFREMYGMEEGESGLFFIINLFLFEEASKRYRHLMFYSN